MDLHTLVSHANWLVDAGCRGIVALGSLGEGGTLDPGERREVLRTLVGTVGGRVPVVASVAALSTREALRQAREAEDLGCAGLMVLPPYVYRPTAGELEAHFLAILGSDAGRLPAMLYNNPIAYAVDVQTLEIARLAERCPRLAAVKESSGDVRRITDLSQTLGDRLAIMVGLDDLVVEGVMAGAVGWVAGLVNALPSESVRLMNLSLQSVREGGGTSRDLKALYSWFLPMLRLDTGPDFVQAIKAVQARVGRGSARVRPPRRELDPAALDRVNALVDRAMTSAPHLP